MTERSDAYQGIELKEIDRKKKKHRKKHYLLRFVVFLAILAGVFVFLKSDYFMIREIEVTGNNYYTDREVIEIARAETGGNIIFELEAGEIEAKLLQNPYFTTADVKRSLPSTIIISVTERKQLAAVSVGENYAIIDGEGVVLRQSATDPKLTILTGLTIRKMDVGEVLEAEESDVLSMTLRMLSAMSDGDLYFKKIDVSKVVVRAYIYDSLIVKGTPAEINNAISRGELQKVISNLFSEGISRGTITMGGDSYVSFSPETDGE